VVSRLFAAKFWPGERAVGKRVMRSADVEHKMTVVGVVGDVNDAGFGQPQAPTVYVPYAQNNLATASVGLVIRTAGDPLAMAKTVSDVVHQIDPAQPLSGVTTLDTFLGDSLGPDRFRGALLLVFAATGLLIASVGIYGVASRGVAERTRELGLRLALGGRPSQVRALVLRYAGAGIAAGFILGWPAAWLSERALRHWLPGVGDSAPGGVAMASALLAVAGLVSAGVPALRAGRVDPLVALRAE
jgi:predicted lysophospholipase L1 biosynthesis ABC-type transport system permease subunit